MRHLAALCAVAALALSGANAARAAEVSADTTPCPQPVLAAMAAWAEIDGDLGPYDTPPGLVVTSACKPAPDEPGTTIAVAALDVNHDGPGAQDGEKLQLIALVDAGNHVLAARRDTVGEDALTQIGSYRIDTARYGLGPGQRAFGVVFASAAPGPSCADASASDELTLYVRDGSTLRPVMGTNLNGWVTIEGSHCSLRAERFRSADAQITVGVLKTQSFGHADLSLTARVTETGSEQSSPDADAVELPRVERTVRALLRYDGTSYGIDMFRTFWYPESVK